jgi:hypothetical protein
MSRKKLDRVRAVSLATIVVYGLLFVKQVWTIGTKENAANLVDEGAGLLMQIDEVVESLDID